MRRIIFECTRVAVQEELHIITFEDGLRGRALEWYRHEVAKAVKKR